jgi:uncharacterized protein
MDRQAIIARLRAHRQHLRAFGVESVSLFGSAARDELTAESDVDLAVRLSDGFSEGGFDYFAKLDALRKELSTVLEQDVDLIEEPTYRPALQVAIERDRIVAFQ